MPPKSKVKSVPLREPDTYGVHEGKHDTERFGVFAEMMYMHGMGYQFPKLYGDVRDDKGKQMMTSASKWKVEGLQDCYFDREFKRIFEGEAINAIYKLERKKWKEAKQKFLTPGGFHPQKGNQVSSTPGDHYGTFSGRVEAFSPKVKEVPKIKGDYKKAFSTATGKKGGAGYIDITIGKYPEHFIPNEKKEDLKKEKAKILGGAIKSGWPPRAFDPRPYAPAKGKLEKTYIQTGEKEWTKFGQFYPPSCNKTLGGMKGGGFSKFPEYESDRYIDFWRIHKYGPTGKFQKVEKPPAPFFPQARNKTYPVFSPMEKVIDNTVTSSNFRQLKPVTYTREFVML